MNPLIRKPPITFPKPSESPITSGTRGYSEPLEVTAILALMDTLDSAQQAPLSEEDLLQLLSTTVA